MPDLSPTAVTLKINKTSVMLYACIYVRLPEGVGATVQTYLGSFPVTATEVPPKFAALMREATLGRPDRYQELMARITNKVLEPARTRLEREAVERQRVAITQALAWATQALQDLSGLANFDALVRTPELQAALAGLLGAVRQVTDNAAGALVMTAPVGQPDDKPLPFDAPLW
jgi:hypothetical protein